MRVLVLKASPRRDGNSALLADAAATGAREAGHEVTVLHLDDFVEGMLRDCRTCRQDDGSCGIGDGYERLLVDHLVPADAVVLATPLYWYGMSGRLKSAVDRLFCFMSAGDPQSGTVLAGLPGKRVAVLIACEESYRGATLGLQAQFQELTRYLRQDLVGVVVGIGNSRGDVRLDPGNPLDAASDLGRRLFDVRVTDYRFDTPRDHQVWSTG
ncbi:MAG: Multimeric flavodoxin WrbA [Modestobacter sp.]|jgi:multimeric flavodoxin WrbA|nr:Multimeric flavodoxin WrbA [Modestobacter sp.]